MDNVIAVLGERGYAPEQIVDVGANIGTSTLEMLAAFPNATATAIEPHPDNYRLLRRTWLPTALRIACRRSMPPSEISTAPSH